MELTVHPTAQLFLQACQADLEARETVNGLMLGLALRLRDDPAMADTDAYLVTVRDDDGLVLAALMTVLNVILYSPREKVDEALRLTAEDLLKRGRHTPGVFGPVTLARRFAETWRQASGQNVHTAMDERCYELRQVTWPPQPGGSFRDARDEDYDLLCGWAADFQREALGEDDIENARRVVTLALAGGRLFVWQDGGQVVSMAASSRPTVHGMTVNLVYTPPELRGRGYASACVAALSQRILDSGKQFCTLFTNLANPVSNSIYQKIGYRPVCDFVEIHFEG